MKFATVLLLMAALITVLLKSTTSKTAEEPKETLRELLDDHVALGDSESRRKLVSKYISKRHQASATSALCERDYCQIPEDENVKILNNNKYLSFFKLTTNPQLVTKAACHPKEVPVRIMTGPHTMPYPSFVTLHRCIGRFGSDVLHYHCRVKEKEEIQFQYLDLFSYQMHTTNMYSHAKCSYECSLRQEDCKSNEKVDSSKCECKCDLDPSQCNNDQWLDQPDCECKCKPLPACNGLMKRNKDCRCECDPRLRDICRDHNLVLEPNYCTCV